MTTPYLKKVIKSWQEQSAQNFDVIQLLFQHKKNVETLFFGHLTLEKLLKALVVKATKQHAPFIHDLVKLARLANLPLTEEQRSNLEKITEFNIAGRYDNEKLRFREKCTNEFTKKYYLVIKNYYQWLNDELSRNQ